MTSLVAEPPAASPTESSLSATEPLTESVRAIRRRAQRADLHEESLLRIPLVHQAFTDLRFALTERAVDPTWTYEKTLSLSVTGFNPFAGAWFYGRRSRAAEWLEHATGSARDFNENDLLVKEVLFMAHDYLHAWAYQAMHALCPELDLLETPVTRQNFDDLVFCHLTSEAVATVGLDYWCLSVEGINRHCAIGSRQGPLTVSFQESHVPEYRRFDPDFDAQQPSFFGRIARFYANGEFEGFGLDDMRRSPQLLAWLKHELAYGVTQRRITRDWFTYLCEEPVELSLEEREAAIPVDTPMRRRLLAGLCEALWRKVHGEGDLVSSTRPWNLHESRRRASPQKEVDFRFVNIHRVDPAAWHEASGDATNFRYWLAQYLVSIPFESVPEERLDHVGLLLREKNVALALDLFRDLPRLEPRGDEPRDLFVVN